MNNKLLDYFNGDELAASVWLSKYAQEGEETPDDMHRRMAKEFAKIEIKYGANETPLPNEVANKVSEYAKKRVYLTEDRIYNLFKDFKYIIPQGSVMSQLGSKSIGSLSNCFVIGQPEDSYGGIFKKDEEEAQLMKRRGGVGIDISTLRPSGVKTSNAAKSSTGAVSFMHRFSNTTREVAQNGRRGALMISMDVNHPDIMEFIKIKRDLTKVTGANISIKLNEEFMKAVENDEDYILRFPCHINPDLDSGLPVALIDDNNGLHKGALGYYRRIRARQYWEEIIKSAHGVAEPGLMFWDNMINYSPDGVYDQYKAITTNPCSEIGMQAYDACRLIAVNLYSFVQNPFTDVARFDFQKFYEVNYEAMRLSDDLVDLEIQHINRILDKIKRDPEAGETKRNEIELWKKVRRTASSSRRTGLGFTGLGDTLAALGFAYDSDEALTITETIMNTKMASELDCTTDMAITRGTFEGWDKNLEFQTKMDSRGKPVYGKNPFYQFLMDEFKYQVERMWEHGRRNASWSTVAPTGSLSMLAQVSSGIEPVFLLSYMRRKKINPNDTDAFADFIDDNGDAWQEYPVFHKKFADWYFTKMYVGDRDMGMLTSCTQEDIDYYQSQSPYANSTAPEIDWVKRVRMQAMIQKYISHSISSTINLPEDVSLEAVSEIYMEAWKQGVKGITVYREGSRSGVLVSNNSKTAAGFEQRDAYKRPEELEAHAHRSTSKGISYHVLVGLMDDKPYEIFIDDSDNRYSSEGRIVKEARGKYIFKNGGDPVEIRDFMTPEQQAITRLVSMGLRHGTEIKYVVEQLQKIDGDMFSFAKSLARVLKKYIPDGAKATVSCKECGSDNVIFEEGCHKCLDCGSSKCG